MKRTGITAILRVIIMVGITSIVMLSPEIFFNPAFDTLDFATNFILVFLVMLLTVILFYRRLVILYFIYVKPLEL